MTINAQSSAVSSLWSKQPKSRLTTDKGVIIYHHEKRSFFREDSQHPLILNDKGVFTEQGHEYPQLGKLSTELADVTEQLRLLWLEAQARNADYVNEYEERQAQRRERYIERAERARAEGNAAHQRANAMLDVIPLGQPILIGHHSEGRHRSTLKRADNLYRHAFVKCAGKASHYESKADGVGRGGVSGDDPEAVRKLLEQLQGSIQAQQTMKACNAAIRRHKTPEAQRDALQSLGLSEANTRKLIDGDFCGRVGYPSFHLQNNNAEIKRLKKRIEELKAVRDNATDSEEEYEGFKMKTDTEENRIMFIFDGKPAEEIRALLKSYAFKWSPSRGAWVRKTTQNALCSAERLKAELIKLNS